MDTNVSQVRYTFEITSDEANLLQMLIESLASKEGLVIEDRPVAEHGEFSLNLGPPSDHPYLLIECTQAPDKKFNLRVQRLEDDTKAHQHMVTFADFMMDWYTELRKAFFR